MNCQLLVERCRKPIIMCVLIIVFIECMQLIFKIGFFDVDDIFLNLLGCLSGICISLFLNNTDKNKGE